MTTLKFTLSEIQDENIIIPEGTRATPGSNILFATVEAGEIPAGQQEITITAECTVENLSESYGGSNIESDENFRERI